MSNPLALVIDDEPDICELLSLTLGRMQVDTCVGGDIASAKGEFALSNHLYERVHYLARRGLPRINMEPFEYVAPAAEG